MDIVDVPRLEGILERRPEFEQEVLTRREIVNGLPPRRRAINLARGLAAKEAFLKAVGLGLWEGVSLHDIELVLDDVEHPCLRLGPRALGALARTGGRRATVTLGRSRGTVIALVMVGE
jgi:holo-[acyl-carrier protein] synthase